MFTSDAGGGGDGEGSRWWGAGDNRCDALDMGSCYGSFTQQLDFVDTVYNCGLTIIEKEELLISIKYKGNLLAKGLKSSQ